MCNCILYVVAYLPCQHEAWSFLQKGRSRGRKMRKRLANITNECCTYVFHVGRNQDWYKRPILISYFPEQYQMCLLGCLISTLRKEWNKEWSIQKTKQTNDVWRTYDTFHWAVQLSWIVLHFAIQDFVRYGIASIYPLIGKNQN